MALSTGPAPRVGLVVVSHSRALAGAAVALAREMLHGADVRIEVAAGLDERTFGTDAVQIVEAIRTADTGAGVVVLMDLSSAVLSAELALEMLDEPTRERALLCPAPLVEGLVVAAVSAAGGADRGQVAAEATAALAGKTSHLGEAALPAASEASEWLRPTAVAAGEVSGQFTVTNPHGLHARPAARVVQAVRMLDAQVSLRNRTTASAWVPAGSLSKVATLGALQGHEVEVRVAGNQAQQALDEVLALAARAFDEDFAKDFEKDFDEGTAGAAGLVTRNGRPDRPEGGRAGSRPIAASPGIGIGPAFATRSAPIAVPQDLPADEPVAEWRRLTESIVAVRRQVQRIRARTAAEVGETDAEIFDAHLLLLDDADLLAGVQDRIDRGQAAAPAWSSALDRVRAEFAAIPDTYLQARAADVAAVRDAVLRELLGQAASQATPVGVLVAGDLTPTEAAELDRSRVAAVVLAFGSPTAHSTILLRAHGIPAVVGAGVGVLDITDGTLLAVDGIRGEVHVRPPAELQARLRARAAMLAEADRRALADAPAPALTRDGVQVLVGANVGSVDDARTAAARGADLIGLVRTEFLFLGRSTPPDVDEQEAVYREIALALGGRRITFRTLDAGGDKPLRYLPMPVEANPFLGIRGIRLSMARPRLLSDQLLAIVRVAREVPVSLMFPMISTVDELAWARRLLDDAISLTGRAAPTGLRVGIMVEVPATALKARTFAAHVDFFSVGTNDLTQYTLAAERGNDALSGIVNPLDPGVLALLASVCRGAADSATPVAVCGELAADQRASALLIGLGVRELSVAPRLIPAVKQAVRGVRSEPAAVLAHTAQAADSANAVHKLLTDQPGGR